MRQLLFFIALFFVEAVASAACPSGEEQCVAGYVWRDAFPGDHVCVSGTVRNQAATENAAADANRVPGGKQCRPGLVWREAEPDDQACVSGTSRSQAASDNAAAPARREPSCQEVPTPDSLSVLTLNVGGFGGGLGADDPGTAFETRMRRVGIWAKRHRVAPDVIALQEVYGWLYTPPVRSCGRGFAVGAGDYDAIDTLLKSLQDMTGVTYRVAYLTGRTGSFGWLNLCSIYHAHAMLYNPARLVNITQTAGNTVAHDNESAAVMGVPHLRRSLPLCSRGTNLMPLASLIDGPAQTDKCGQPTPSGPAHAIFSEKGHIAGTQIRFAFTHNRSKFIDVFNAHPTSTVEQVDKIAIQGLITSLSPPPYVGASLLYPPLLIGDLNTLRIEDDFPKFITTMDAPEGDVPRIGIGKTDSFPAQLRVKATQKLVVPDLPDGMLCQGSVNYLVSDHCGLFVRFDLDGADASQLRDVFVDGPGMVTAGNVFTLHAVAAGGGPNYTYRWQPSGATGESINPTAGPEGTLVGWRVDVTDTSTGQTRVGTHEVKSVQVSPPRNVCMKACAETLGKCMHVAHTSGDRQECIADATQCRAGCQ